MVRKQVRCGRCKRVFWSPVKKAYILIAKKMKGKQEVRVVRGAFMKRVQADREKINLEKQLCPKEFDKIDVEPQLTVQKYLCQRCRNFMSMMQNRGKHQKAVEKQIGENRPIQEISKENAVNFMRYQVQQKVVQDYRKKMQEEARETARKEREAKLIKAEEDLKKLQLQKEVLLSLKAEKNVKTKSVGEDKRKTA